MAFPPHLGPLQASAPFLKWFESSRFSKRAGDPAIADLVFGNPHEMPLPAYVAVLQKYLTPQDKDWFAYKLNTEPAARAVAKSLQARTGLAFEHQDVFLTNGGFGAIAVTLRTVAGPGDEVIFLSPPWFFYDMLIGAAGATAVRVKLAPPHFELDAGAIEASITDRTRAVIVNSPHNPTGRIYGSDELRALAAMLTRASKRIGHDIALLSDEAYVRIAFDGQKPESPARYYPHTFVLYSYGKQLLAPGQRIGYIALPPAMPGREALREAILIAQFATGFAFPNALLQHALPELEPLCISIADLERRRDRMLSGLAELGYEAVPPAGTFYVVVRSPIEDDLAFCDRLADHDTFVMPGTVLELPGYFRISLTANDAMIEQSLRAFAAAREDASALGAVP